MELTLQRDDATTVLLEPAMEHIDRGIVSIAEHCKSSGHILRGLLLWLLLLGHAHIVVEYKEAQLVARLDALLKLLRFDCGGQIDLASGETAQHNAGYAKVNSAAYVRLAVLLRAAAVEYDQLLGGVAVGSQLRLEPLFAAALVLRFRHLEKLLANALTRSLTHTHTQ